MGATSERRRQQGFGIFAWIVLAYNLPVILWGAYVRISFSGEGCGAHWPFCNGQVIPHKMTVPLAIEFIHRTMTGLDAIAVVAMCIWAFSLFPRRHPVRLFSALSLASMFVEVLLGAGLVLFRYVARDQSAGRAWYLSAHLANTMLLLGAITIAAWLAYSGSSGVRLREVPRLLLGALAVTLVVSVTGAVAALGDTLFPAASLGAGLQADFSAPSLMVRLRSVHPFVAVIGAGYLVWAASGVLRRQDAPGARTAATRVLGLILFQLVAGAINLMLLAPVWMQLFHLFLSDVVWIAVILLTLEASQVRQPVPAFALSKVSAE